MVLGEHKIGTDPDCAKEKNGRKGICFPKKIVRTVGKAIVHENYQPQGVLGRSIIFLSLGEFFEVPLKTYSRLQKNSSFYL